MNNFIYLAPDCLDETIKYLKKYKRTAAILAGGTDLLNHIRIGKKTPEVVISLKNVNELRGIINTDDGLFIGAMSTLTEIETNKTILESFEALSEAASKVGSRQIRNRATLVGNICNASPAADTVTALLLFDPIVHVAGGDGSKAYGLNEFITGVSMTTLSENELVAGIFLPFPQFKTASSYYKLSRREGVDLATVGAAAGVDEYGNVRIAMGAVAPKAFRAYKAEALLTAAECGNDFEAAFDEVINQASPISDLRGSREYRLAMTRVYAKRAYETAKKRMEAKLNLE